MTVLGIAPVSRPLLGGDVLRAWSEATSSTPRPARVDVLKPRNWLSKWGPAAKPRSYVFRIHTPGASHPSIIAKYCDGTTGKLERLLYAEVLPHLGISAPYFIGASDPDELSRIWLFLEDVGDEESYVYSSHRDNALLSTWVAKLHTEAARLSERRDWPDRGTSYYRWNLERAIRNLRACRSGQEFDSQLTSVARSLESELASLLENWEAVQQGCERIPSSLVHGDLKRKHLRTRTRSKGREILAFDWELAGWGLVTTDLASGRLFETKEGLRSYWRKVSANSTDVSFAELQDLTRMGLILRGIVAGHWASENLLVGRARTARDVPLYVEQIRGNRRALGL